MKRWLPWLLMGILLTGCGAFSGEGETITPESPTQTSTVTATIQWFPATVTPTPFAVSTSLPTPDLRQGAGEQLFTDDFTDSTLWQTYQGTAGSALIGAGEINLSAAAPYTTLLSLRSGEMPLDYYFEITTEVNLCETGDSFGAVFRASSEQNYYRLMLACDGGLRLEKVVNGVLGVVSDWTPSGQVRGGAPLTVRIGVWVWKNEFRIFLNDIYQFSARDPSNTAGGIGVVARASAGASLSVSFSDLAVQRIEGYVPSPVPTDTPDTRSTARTTPTP